MTSRGKGAEYGFERICESMTDGLVETLVHTMEGSALPEVIVFVISMLPIVELRGGILAAKLLGVDLLPAFLICGVGTLLPVPFLLLFVRKVFDLLRKTRFVTAVRSLEAKAQRSIRKINSYRTLGLLAFVAIPLPGTGAWTGCLAAVFMNMSFKYALISVVCGTLLADGIMCLLSYGVLGAFL